MRVPRSSAHQTPLTIAVDEKGSSSAILRRNTTTNVDVASGEHATMNGTTTTTTTTTTSVNNNDKDDNNDGVGVGVGIGSGNNDVKAINSQLILNAPSTAKDKEPKNSNEQTKDAQQ